MIRIHATCIAMAGRGVLLAGASGVGKSDLALRMIDRGAQLVSDDYTELDVRDTVLFARPPALLRGKIEVRGLGIQPMNFVEGVPVALFIALDESPERLPQDVVYKALLGIEVRKYALAGLEPSAPIKLELMLAQLAEEH